MDVFALRQQLIGDYGTRAYGMQLFTPCAGEEI